MADKEERQIKTVPRTRKYSKFIKKGREGKVKFQAYRKIPSFKRNKKRFKIITKKSKIFKKNTLDRFNILFTR